MEQVDAFLEKFQEITPPDATVKKEVIDVVAGTVGVELDTEQISIDGNGIRITTSAAAKSSIFIQKEAIIEKLQKRLEEEAPSDIQ